MSHQTVEQHLQRVTAAREGLRTYHIEMGRVRELEQHLPTGEDRGYDINATRGYQQWLQTYQALEADQLDPLANERLDRMSSILTNIRDEFSGLNWANTPEMQQIFVDRRMEELRTTGETYMRAGHDRHFNVVRIARLEDGGYSYTVYDAGHESQGIRNNELGHRRVDAVIERRLLPGADPAAILHGNVAKMFSTAGTNTYDMARDYINSRLDPNPVRVVEDTAQIRNNCSTMGQRILLQDVTRDLHLSGKFYDFMTDQLHTPKSLDALLESKARAIAAGHPGIVRAQNLQESGWEPYKSAEGGQVYRYQTPFGNAGERNEEMQRFQERMQQNGVDIAWADKGGKVYAYVIQSSNPESCNQLGRMMGRTSQDLATQARIDEMFFGSPEQRAQDTIESFLTEGLGRDNVLAVERGQGATKLTVTANFSRSELANLGIDVSGVGRSGFSAVAHVITIPDGLLPEAVQARLLRIEIGAQQWGSQQLEPNGVAANMAEKETIQRGPFEAQRQAPMLAREGQEVLPKSSDLQRATPAYELVDGRDPTVIEIRDRETGRHFFAKINPTAYEIDMVERASRVQFPPEIDNVHIPKLISKDIAHLPEEFAGKATSVIIVEKADGHDLQLVEMGRRMPGSRYDLPELRSLTIGADDFRNLETAVAHMNAQGVQHTDLKNSSNIFVRQDDKGRTHFSLIDWGGPFDPAMRDNDLDALSRKKETLLKSGIISDVADGRTSHATALATPSSFANASLAADTAPSALEESATTRTGQLEASPAAAAKAIIAEQDWVVGRTKNLDEAGKVTGGTVYADAYINPAEVHTDPQTGIKSHPLMKHLEHSGIKSEITTTTLGANPGETLTVVRVDMGQPVTIMENGKPKTVNGPNFVALKNAGADLSHIVPPDSVIGDHWKPMMNEAAASAARAPGGEQAAPAPAHASPTGGEAHVDVPQAAKPSAFERHDARLRTDLGRGVGRATIAVDAAAAAGALARGDTDAALRHAEGAVINGAMEAAQHEGAVKAIVKGAEIAVEAVGWRAGKAAVKAVAGKVPGLGVAVGAVFLVGETGYETVQAIRGKSEWTKVGSTALSGLAGTVGGLVGFGAGEGLQEVVHEATKRAFGEKNAAAHSGTGELVILARDTINENSKVTDWRSKQAAAAVPAERARAKAAMPEAGLNDAFTGRGGAIHAAQELKELEASLGKGAVDEVRQAIAQKKITIGQIDKNHDGELDVAEGRAAAARVHSSSKAQTVGHGR